MDEKQILEGIRASQVESYENLIDVYSSYIARVTFKVSSNRLTKEDMEEVCADVFVKLWENRYKLTIKEGSLKAYLGAMTRNHTLNKIRAKVNYELLPLEEDIIEYTTPESDLMAKESDDLINELVSTLPEPDREIFIRRYFYMEKLSEIAKHIGINPATVGTKLFRGKKKLEQLLKERGECYE